MYKLYGWKLTGSLASEAALREVGEEYEIIPVHIDGDGHVQVAASPEYEEILARFQMLSEEFK